MNARYWAWLVVVAIASLTPLAYASPPDPSWIRGLYDGGDFDDVVILLTGAAGIVGPFPIHAVGPLSVVGSVLSADDRHVPTPVSVANPARAPPAS